MRDFFLRTVRPFSNPNTVDRVTTASYGRNHNMASLDLVGRSKSQGPGGYALGYTNVLEFFDADIFQLRKQHDATGFQPSLSLAVLSVVGPGLQPSNTCQAEIRESGSDRRPLQHCCQTTTESETRSSYNGALTETVLIDGRASATLWGSTSSPVTLTG